MILYNDKIHFFVKCINGYNHFVYDMDTKKEIFLHNIGKSRYNYSSTIYLETKKCTLLFNHCKYGSHSIYKYSLTKQDAKWEEFDIKYSAHLTRSSIVSCLNNRYIIYLGGDVWITRGLYRSFEKTKKISVYDMKKQEMFQSQIQMPPKKE